MVKDDLIVLVYILNIDKVKKYYNQFIEYITEKRREKIESFKFEKDKLASLGAGYLMYQYLGIESDDDLLVGPYGKLYLKSKSYFFNISHSGDYVVLAVADEELGVDIEEIEIAEAIKSVPSKAFTSDEKNWLAKQHSDEAFSILWTKKEAVLKADGQGFYRDPQSISVLDTKEFFIEYEKIENYILSCAMKKPFRMNLIFA